MLRGARGPAYRISGPEGDSQRIVGGFRFRRAHENWLRGAQSLSAPIEAAIPLHHGWWFATHGTAFRAEGFTDDLQRASSHDTGGRIGHGPGREVHIVAGALVGAAAPHEPLRVIDAAFSSESHGVAITEPGMAWATDDGGTHWSTVPLAHDTAERVVASDTARWVIGHETAIAIADDGTHDERPLDRAPGWSTREVDDSVVSDLTRGIDADPVEVLARAIEHGAREGTRVYALRENQVVTFDVATDRWLADPGGVLPCRARSLVFTAALQVVCDTGTGVELLTRTREGEWTARLATMGDRAAVCHASPDGGTVACDGVCAGDPSGDPAQSLCVRTGDTPPHTVLAGPGRTGLAGGIPWRLLEVAHDAVRLAAPMDDLQTTTRPMTPRSDWPTLEAWSLDGDGHFRIVARDATSRWGLLEGRLEGTVFAHPMPDDVSGVWLADGSRAWRTRGDRALEGTEDDASSWHRVADVPGVTACSAVGCVGPDRVVLGSGGDVTPSVESALSISTPPGTPAVTRGPPAWQCAARGAVLHIAHPDAPVGLSDTVSSSEDARGDLVVRERPSRRAESGIEVTASWVDREHATPGRAAPSSTFRLDRLAGPATQWTAARFAPGRADLVRCGTGPAQLAPRCDLVVVSPPGRGSIVATVPRAPWITVHDATTLALLSLANEASPATVVTLGVDGSASAHTLTLDDDGVGLFVLDGGAGVLRASDDGTLLLEPATHITAAATTDVCPATARGDLAVPIAIDLQVDTLPLHALHAFAHYGLDGDHRCLRALEGSIEQLGPPGWLRAEPGLAGITGSTGTHLGTAPITCRAPELRHGGSGSSTEAPTEPFRPHAKPRSVPHRHGTHRP